MGFCNEICSLMFGAGNFGVWDIEFGVLGMGFGVWNFVVWNLVTWEFAFGILSCYL